MDKEGDDNVNNDGNFPSSVENVQMPNFANVVRQNLGIGSGDWDHGDELVLTTYVTVTEDPAEASMGLSTQTLTVTITSYEEVTITLTEAPKCLITAMAPPTQVQTVTATEVANPPGRVCTTIGTAIAVPTILVVALGMVGGAYLWLLLKKRRDSSRYGTATTNRFSLMGGSNENSSTPTPCSIPQGNGGGGGGGDIDAAREGIMAPPPSLVSRAGGPFADPTLPLDYNDTSASTAHGIQVRRDASTFQSQRSSVVSSLSPTVPQSSSSMDLFQGAQPNTGIATRSNSIATVLSETTNGQAYRPGRAFVPMNDGEFVGFDNGNYDSGRTRFPMQLRTVVYAPPANVNDDVGPVIRPAQTAPLRPIEIVGSSHSSRRASMVDEQEFTNSHSSVCAPTTQGPARLVEVEGSAVLSRFPSGAKGNDEGSGSKNNNEEASQTLGKGTPFELSADSPAPELDTDKAVFAPNK
ncbi:uncharacterized protein DNG_04736 [Cephalotrichum gorgonifer]|uniref:Transmembrane protein n=1 Tax=Cephalotrichum gorgonifer TaxID=2041049 RepID=A0AAE8MZ18_9PEZI|nr:uncharacterized protein DNG_04736 [Cephalotrichum gorgonifer]